MIEKPIDCSSCPLREIFFDSDWSIKQGIRHLSCRMNLDRVTEIGKGIPAYCPLVEINDNMVRLLEVVRCKQY